VITTIDLLIAEYGQADVRLDEVSEKYFGLSPKTASAHAAKRALPVLAYRASDSQKAPWLIRVTDLADYLDNRRSQRAALL
jgi:hypothetical protein